MVYVGIGKGILMRIQLICLLLATGLMLLSPTIVTGSVVLLCIGCTLKVYYFGE